MRNRALTRRVANLEGQFHPEETPTVITVEYVDNNRQVVGTQRMQAGSPAEWSLLSNRIKWEFVDEETSD